MGKRNRGEVRENPLKKKKSKSKHDTLSSSSFITPDFENLSQTRNAFWDGAHGEDPPSESLKETRKGLGILVRGELRLCPQPVETVDDKNLPVHFSQVFKSLGFDKPSPIQKQCWPAILMGANVLGIAPTGSGKTLGYICPMIPHILHNSTSKSTKPGPSPGPNCLVIVPTRELAIQVHQNTKICSKLFSIRSTVIYGGQDKDLQLQSLCKDGGPHIVVATPGRLLDLLRSKEIRVRQVSYLVLDEADRMLALGFEEQISTLLAQIRPDRQVLLFTATFPGKLREATNKWVDRAVTIRCSTMEITSAQERPDKVGKDNTPPVSERARDCAPSAIAFDLSGSGAQQEGLESATATAPQSDANSDGVPSNALAAPAKARSDEALSSSLTISRTITQTVHVCAAHKKPRLLIKFVLATRAAEKEAKTRQPGLMLIFCTKIKTVKFVHDFLKRQEQATGCEILHGSLPQVQRERILANFKAGKLHTVIATDVAARGIHVKRLRYVVNYDFPTTLEQYCHRIGRTGRQGEAGIAYSLISRNMAPLVPGLVSLLRNCGQTPEPNLLALSDQIIVGEVGEGGLDQVGENDDEDDDDENDDGDHHDHEDEGSEPHGDSEVEDEG